MKAFIVAQRRTGSTLLYEFLDSHPGIFCADELFIGNRKIDYRLRMLKVYGFYKEKHGWDVDQYLTWVFSLSPIACIKILYHQIDMYQMHDIILKHPVIHLIRTNYLKRVVSDFKIREEIDRRKPMEYIDDMQISITRDAQWSKTLLGKAPMYLRLDYEDIVGRHETVRGINYTFMNEKYCELICKFFRVPYFEMFTATQKALSDDPWEYIPEEHREPLKNMLEENFPAKFWGENDEQEENTD